MTAKPDFPSNSVTQTASEPQTESGANELLKTVGHLIAHTTSNATLGEFKIKSIQFSQPGDTSPAWFVLETVISGEMLNIHVIGQQIWRDREYFSKTTFDNGNVHAGVCSSATIALLIHDDQIPAPEVVARAEEIMQSDSSRPIWMVNSPVQIASIPMTQSSWYACLTSLRQIYRTVRQTRPVDEDTKNDSENIAHLMSISRELNGERDIPKLLNLILLKAREVCGADAGSIYTIESAMTNGPATLRDQDDILQFRFTQNHSIKQNLSEFKLPINKNSIVGNAVLRAEPINITDLYKLDADPSKNPYGIKHDRTWDLKIGYQSRSMLTLPMFDISHQVIGVIQLINCKTDAAKRLLTQDDFENDVIPFDSKSVKYAEIVAQQAGIALENARMTEEIQQLFDGLVEASVTAIEQRDPTTSGHSNRVAALTVELAKVVDRIDTGNYGRIKFSEDEMREIRYASLLHDFGKLGVREAVLLKPKKLFPQDLALIEERFKLVRAAYEIEYLKGLLELHERPDLIALGMNPEQLLAERDLRNNMLNEFLDFIYRANEPTVLEQGGFDRLRDIANVRFSDIMNVNRNLLENHEVNALSVSRGSLTAEEFSEIQSHVTHTYEFLRKIPWGKKLANVPQIAAKHHEKLDGSGYPTSAVAEQIPVQSRMMTIADIYDALSANDRPYKKSLPPEKALDILDMEVKGGKLDGELFRLFVESKAYLVTSTQDSGAEQKSVAEKLTLLKKSS